MKRAAASILLAGLLLGCRSETPEAQVRAAFEACRTAVEAGDAAAATAPLDAAFQGPDGLDRASSRSFLQATFRQQRVGVTVLRSVLTERNGEILQEVDLVLTGKSGALLPEEASHREFHLRWRKVSGTWRLVELRAADGN
ncbi:MAG: hypothetical protein WCO20_04395 [Holophagaceae bacterium]